jgi:hypothetical protein
VANERKVEPIIYVTPQVVALHPYFLTPDIKEGRTGKSAQFATGDYGARLLVKKDIPGLKELKIKLLQALEQENFPGVSRDAADAGSNSIKASQLALRDGDAIAARKPGRDYLKGHYVLKVHSKYPPDVIVTSGAQAVAANIYSGCTVVCELGFKGYDARDNPKIGSVGTTIYVNNVLVMDTIKSPKIGSSRPSAREAFAALLGGSTDEDFGDDLDL